MSELDIERKSLSNLIYSNKFKVLVRISYFTNSSAGSSLSSGDCTQHHNLQYNTLEFSNKELAEDAISILESNRTSESPISGGVTCLRLYK